MILYTKNGCPRCKILKAKLDAAAIKYDENSNIEEQIALGFKSAPTLVLDNGDKLDFEKALNYVREATK